MLLSTHILTEVEATCSRALVIAEGTLVAEGTIDDLARCAASRGVRVVVAAPARASARRSPRTPAIEEIDALRRRRRRCAVIAARRRAGRTTSTPARRPKRSSRPLVAAGIRAARGRRRVERLARAGLRRAHRGGRRREGLLADLQARALRALRHAARVGAHHRRSCSCRACTSSSSSLTSRSNAELTRRSGARSRPSSATRSSSTCRSSPLPAA